MNFPCPRFAERLISLAEGASDPAVEAHMATCPGCSEAFQQFRSIVQVAQRQAFAVPVSVVEAAKSIAPATRRTVMARLIRSNAVAGARAIPADLHVALDADGHPMRVMYTRRETGWDVMGTLPGPDWCAEREHKPIDCNEDRFTFLASRLEATGFRVSNRNSVVIVSPIEEMLYGTSGSR